MLNVGRWMLDVQVQNRQGSSIRGFQGPSEGLKEKGLFGFIGLTTDDGQLTTDGFYLDVES